MTDDPISEQYRLIAKKWVEADKEASLMEECKSAVYSQMINKHLTNEVGEKVPMNRIETMVKASKEYGDYVREMVELRSEANLLKVKLEYLRMKHAEQQSAEATARAERRL